VTDALASVESNVDAARAECAAKAKVLYDRMRIWFALLTRDMSDFVASAYTGTPVVVEDQLSDGGKDVQTCNSPGSALGLGSGGLRQGCRRGPERRPQ
jgi:hypothetical protein